ncbi:MAG: hypothetical protein ACK4ON_02660, partial [Bacteroidia bacterium]
MAQINLIPNSKFELGVANNRNDYCKYPTYEGFNDDLLYWKGAKFNKTNTVPHWIDLSIDQCGNVLVGNYNIT